MNSVKQTDKKMCDERRGYFSEIITDKNDEELRRRNKIVADRKTKYTWRIRTPKYVPVVYHLVPPQRPRFLAPAERWMTYREEPQIQFPEETLKPKVQHMHLVEPRLLPRKVWVERRRRQYQSQSIKRLLKEMDIKPFQLIPVDVIAIVVPETIRFRLYSKYNFLPLEIFDNEEYDSQTTDEWLNMGLLEGVKHPIPAEAYLPFTKDLSTPTTIIPFESLATIYEWKNVAVTNYDRETKLYSILTLDGYQSTYKVPRIYLLFKAEDPKTFASRIKDAIDRRQEAEDRIKFEFYLDCMLVTAAYDMDEESLKRIFYLATRNKQFKIRNAVFLERVEHEIRLNYKRTLCEMQFIQCVNSQPYIYKFLKLPKKEIRPVPEKGRIAVPMANFPGMRDYVKWINLYALAEVYRAMAYVALKCQKVSAMSMFTTSYGKYVTLGEFEAVQVHTTDNVIKYLKGKWLESLTLNIRMYLGDIGKGWYNLLEKQWDIYHRSKIYRFMELVKHRMQFALRCLVENSIHMIVTLVETPCQCTLDVADDFVWGKDVITTQFKPSTTAIFNILLELNEVGAFYNIDVKLYGIVLLLAYDNAVRKTHYVQQVHPFLLSNLRFPNDLTLSSVGLLDPIVVYYRNKLVLGYQKAIIPLMAYCREYDKHNELFMLDVEEYITKFTEENHPAAEIKDEISLQAKHKRNLETTLPENIMIGPFWVNVEPLKTFLVNKRFVLYTRLLEMFTIRMRDQTEEVLVEYKGVMFKLNEKPQSIEHIFEIREWMETIPVTVRTQEDTMKRLLLEYDILDHFWWALSDEDFECKWEAVGWPLKIQNQVEATNEFLDEETERYLKIQFDDEVNLVDRIDGYTSQVLALSAVKDYNKINELAVEIRRLWKNMKESQEQGLLLNQRQKLFGKPVVPFEDLNKLVKEFEPYKNLWITAADWLKWENIWMDNPLVNIDSEAIERQVNDMYKMMVRSIRVFADFPGVQQIALTIKSKIENFRPMVPLIQAVRNPGMRQRHWDDFLAESGIQIEWNDFLTFNNCLEQGVADFSESICKISESAAKEYAIELTLDKMAHEWESNLMEVTPYKNTGTYIMKVAEELIQMLDDHIVMTQQISFSPFKAAFEERINEWEDQLRVTSAVLDEWIEVQRLWMYLEPIFTSEDITRQLPMESKKYNAMDRTWRRIMKGAHELPKILDTCPDRKLLESLKDCKHMLEMVEKGLSEYLELKRSVFPRFYFLSDDELLEILSQAKNALSVQPHLKKCFENISTLTFEADLRITQMVSGDGETVDLKESMYPTGGVEYWLLAVESAMMETVRLTLADSLVDIEKKDRSEWVLSWPGQVVIAGSQTCWTSDVEHGILEDRLQHNFDIMLHHLDGLRGLLSGGITRLQRNIIGALITIEVHARDVTEKILKDKVSNINDFDWISQLRYYWIDDELKIRAVNAEFSYGNEYLGNSGRLVITPLTDRCYLTLTGALHLKFGGAPAGPAGTGKTETTKDLAKAFAIQCVVYNCSDQLDYMAMGKFFKGLASSGAWACFDEFNRIDIEVLSVVAQQVTTIQKAQLAKLERFLFEDCDIALKQSCAVFITMNPGYAGRTELPDNLKALFRPVSMMVPNYALIAEIKLFSFGFSDSKVLANKITTTCTLCVEQLSNQDHYDFGMRTVNTILAACGNLKREKPNMNERQIILRALLDVNVPKFLKDDLMLFNGIVSDLFPRMAAETVNYGDLEAMLRKITLKKGLQDVDTYIHKVIQLYETTVVRHGLMLVGPTGSGKTKCYDILRDSMTTLKGQPSPSGSNFEPCHSYVLNPKSITMGQLYGEFDLQTHEWTDGILPTLVRVGAAATDMDKRWYVFDGPVDAVWIENMNTVLDDNKKLCLTSGEIIKLKDTQTMIFEVADLAVASPATVSRCGMVYLEPSVLGLEPYLNCWLKTVPAQAVELVESMRELFNMYVFPALQVLRTQLKELVTSVDSAIVQSFLHLMEFRLRPLTSKDGRPPPGANFQALMPDLLVPWVVFSLIWSIGNTCDTPSREIFSVWLTDLMKEYKHGPAFPKQGIVYDYKLHDGGFTDQTSDGEPAPATWRSWLENVDEFVITPDTKYSDIEIPTIDKVRNAEMLGMLLTNENNVLCLGPTGTGKTLTISAKLGRQMHKKFICDFIIFSARTSSNQTQDLIDSKLEKRRKGVYGPPLLKWQVFFIDDFNMPALETYGAQPPIELIRQWMDFKGWYDRKEIGVFRHIIDVNFVAAMGPPGGGRNPVTARLLRHYHYLIFTEMEDSSKTKIFGRIFGSWLDRTGGFMSIHEAMVRTTLNVYTVILQELLPTPAKTHYTFNLRDLSKVFQGMLMVNPENISEVEEIYCLWYHECCRVFQDRLVNDADRNWFDGLLREKIKIEFNADPVACLGTETLIYGDYLEMAYNRITDMHKLIRTLNEHLEDYNSQTTKPMKLVLFLDAICHVSRISRVIRQPMGNSLLLGMGGSGRQSLTRMATHMAEFFCFQIELSKTYGTSEWRDDIKTLMLKAGLQNRETVFLFTDSQIKSESFLEDLNNILNSGDVPNIYQSDELDKIYMGMKGIVQEMGLPATKSNLFSAYQKQVRANLHTVITMSPIGEIFRARLRQFPALVNCCTIDWFSAWPDSALQSVAIQFLDDIDELNVSDEILNGIVVMCQYMHQSVVNASEKFLQELSRHNYVTPTSYLELLSSYSSLLGKKKGELTQGIRRLKSGLDKLVTTGEEVKVLQVQLKDMKPALEIAAADAEVMIAQIAADTKVAEETKSVVEKDEREASKKAEITQAIADDAQKDLDEAMPALLAAEESLKALNKNDITEVRTMKRPPAGVLLVIEALCIVRDIKPNKIPGNMPGEKILDYWEPGRAMMSDPGGFLTSMMNFDKSTITEPMIEKLTVYCQNPLFEPAKIIKVSKACTSLCMWVHAMYKYYFVDKAVAPKKAALAQAKIELEEVERALAVTKAKMQAIMKGLADLEEKLNAKIAYKEEQENNINLCEARMSRAVRLVGGLADERVRWLQTIDQLEAGVVNVIGDILISSGCVAYLSPFTDKYRRELLTDWQDVLAERRVPHTSRCNPVSTLGEAVTIRQWQLDGLPRDFLSTENAVLVTNSRRWPLFIDPQGQANKWVRNMGKAFGLAVCKLADKDILRTLESAIRFGKPCLIENVGTELDPALDPILQKQIFKQGGTPVLKLGDVTVPYNDDFRLYITTKLPNPHYTPEISIKVLVVNFTLVPSGLQDQMLALVVMQERPDLEEARSLLVVSSAQMKQELKEIEDRILYKLSASEGSPVDDIDLIVTLESSKVKSTEIKLKVAAAEITQVDIDTTRALYIPVANRAQILFFCLLDLSTVDPMYQYSLEWFTSIFVNSMASTEKSTDINERVERINDYFTFSLYTSVCRSLFEKHKLHFAFLLCIRIMMDEEKIAYEEWHYFLSSGIPLNDRPNPASAWLEARAWLEILALENLKTFAQFVEEFPQHVNDFYRIFQSAQPHREPFPAPWNARLDDFQQMMILKCIRPDRVTNAMQDFLCTHLGQRFVEPQTSDLSHIYKDSSPKVPLIFVLSTGTDPAAELYKFADKMKFSSRLNGISLGQGQGPRAEKLMDEALEIGSWVFFQNCHLAPSWMPRLERLIETIDLELVHKDFRVWLTSTPSPHFPVAILQNGSKMTVEPPRGVKANMLRSYTSKVTEFSEFFHSDGEKVPPFKWLLFALCLFHGACIERRKFGPLGFNIPYEFTDGDLRICISQLHMFLVEYTEIPFKVLTYTAGHINYGGRVTDDWDRRCLLNILGDYYSPDVLDENYKFDSVGSYHQLPSTSNLAKYLSYIREELPLNDDPDLFGLHANADISCARAETYRCLETLLALQPKVVSSGGASQEEVTANVANHILSQIPDLFNVEDVTERYPMLYEESLNTVLIQETIRFNKLLVIIRSSLSDLLKALKGLVVMSEALESMAGSLFKNGVPTMWSAKAYPSLKPLGSWVTDLRARVDFLNKWIEDGIPAIIWISGLYSSQAFLTGTKQNFARKHIVSIDTIEFAFKVMETDPTERPEDGCNIWGLFLEAARWNYTTHFLDESRPKELYTQMPVIWMIPEENHQIPSGIYESPVYKTLTRAGTLSTTGHSTNFVVTVEVPSQKTQRHWIKRGCALICALDY